MSKKNLAKYPRTKTLLTIAQVRFIWHLGFSSGRVQNAAHPNIGVTWEEELPLFEQDLVRLINLASAPVTLEAKVPVQEEEK